MTCGELREMASSGREAFFAASRAERAVFVCAFLEHVKACEACRMFVGWGAIEQALRFPDECAEDDALFDADMQDPEFADVVSPQGVQDPGR